MLFHPPSHFGSDRFRQIFIAHWRGWYDMHQLDIPADQRACVCDIVQRLMGCHNPQYGFARYVCPGCGAERLAPFSCKTRREACPSCGKVRVDRWVNAIALDLLDVPHLHLTLTTDDVLRPFCFQQRALREVQRARRPAEVRLGGGLYPVSQVAVIDVV